MTSDIHPPIKLHKTIPKYILTINIIRFQMDFISRETLRRVYRLLQRRRRRRRQGKGNSHQRPNSKNRFLGTLHNVTPNGLQTSRTPPLTGNAQKKIRKRMRTSKQIFMNYRSNHCTTWFWSSVCCSKRIKYNEKITLTSHRINSEWFII